MSRVRLLGCLLLAVAVSLAAWPTATVGMQPAGSAGNASALAAYPEPGNNSTVQQRNPAEVNAEGDAGELSAWFQDKLAGRLSGSAIQLSQSQYELADRLLGEEYEEMAGKYVDVAGETEEADTETGETFQETADTQREYTDVVEEYNRVYTEYQAAIEAGDEERARVLARQLQDLAGQAERLHGALIGSYQRLSEVSGRDFPQALEAINLTAQNVSARTVTVLDREFMDTQLSVTASRNGSFTSPVRITGRLVGENDSLPASPVRIRLHGRVFEVDLTANGEFEFPFRPVRTAAGSVNLSVVYQPGSESVYLGSNGTVRTTIDSVPPNVSVATPREPVGFQDPVRVNGTVTVGGRVVPNAPVVVRLSGRTIARTRTNERGAFSVRPALSAGVSVGTHSLEVVAGRNGTAIAGRTSTQPVTVVSTPTNLSLAVDQSGQGVVLRGQLTTANGVALSGRTLAVTVGGQLVQTVTTDSSGAYSARYAGDLAVNESLPVRVVFEPRDSNLAPASAKGQLLAQPATQDGVLDQPATLEGFLSQYLPEDGGMPPWWLLAAFAGAVLGLAYAIHRYREPGGGEATPDSSRRAVGPAGSSASEESWIPDRVQTARSLAQEGASGDAIRTVYPALRAWLQAETDGARGLTNWEFYEAVSGRVDSDLEGVLREATEAYERTQYAGDTPDTELVREVVGRVSEMIGDGDRAVYPSGSQREE